MSVMTTMPYNYSYNATTALNSRLRAAVSHSKTLNAAYSKQNIALGTGKYVNTPYDDSIRYFKDAHLSEKAQSISDLLDNISMVTTTLNSVDESLTTLSELIDFAKGEATKAQQALNAPAKVIGDIKLTTDMPMSNIVESKPNDVLYLRSGKANEISSELPLSKQDKLSDFGIALGEAFSVKLGTNDWIDIPVTNPEMTLDDFMKQVVLTLGDDLVTYEFEDNKLTLSTTDQSSITFANRHYDKTTQELVPADTSPSVAAKLGFTGEKLITVDADDTIETLMMEFNSIDGYNAFLDKNNHLQISSEFGDDIIITDFSGKTASALGIDQSARDGENTRAIAAKSYNDILDQINELVKDSIFDGVNLLAGDDMRAVFDEKATCIREIYGVNLDIESMGLAYEENDWTNPDDIEAALNALHDATNQVREAAEYFDRSNAMVSSRETFLSSLSATLQAGADSLTLADLNDVSSQLLAIETQQQLASQVISLTLEINADVLSLF